jgi:hypothetical protein
MWFEWLMAPIVYVVIVTLSDVLRYRAKGEKVNWKKLFTHLVEGLIGCLAGIFLVLRFGKGKGFLFVLAVVVIFFVAVWLARKHTAKELARRIVNYTARGMDAPFKGKRRRLPNAVALCEKWHIRLPPLGSSPQSVEEAQTACMCGKPVAGTDFYPFVSSPLVYRRLRRYNLFARRWLTREERRRHEVDASPLMWNGVLSRLGFCSQECQASFILWNFYIPVTRWQWLRWPFLVVAWRFHRLFHRIFP